MGCLRYDPGKGPEPWGPLDGEPYAVVGVLPRGVDPHLHPSVRDRDPGASLRVE